MFLRKLIFTSTALLTLMLSPAQAQDGEPAVARDVRVVVDISGSMKLNDPENLRRPAVRLLAGLLPEDAGVGLWTFGRDVNMLVSHGILDDAQRDALNEGSEAINSVAQRTNIGAAIEAASDDWYAPERSLADTHLILLSDGKVDIAPGNARNEEERERILQDLVPGLAERGLTIHTIALSAEADLDLLGSIADRTGGVAHVADSADELSRIFADTLGQAVPANEVSLENNRFTVDQGVEEFTALIFSATDPEQRELTLISPDGERHTASSAGTDLRWARESGYDLITASEPAAGEWQVEGTLGDGSRVTVVSNLRLEVEPLPTRFHQGDAVEVRAFFSEDGQRITDPDFLGVIEMRLSMTTADGRSGTRVLSEDQPPEDGLYQDTISQLQEPGQYRLELEADGGTFSRKFRKTLTLVAPEGEQPELAADAPVLPAEPKDDTTEPQADPAPEAPDEPRPVSEGPIDVSQVEEVDSEQADNASSEPEPEPESADEPADKTSWLAWWPWIAGAAGATVLAGLAFAVFRRRRQKDDLENDEEPQADDLPPEPVVTEPALEPDEGEAEPTPETLSEEADESDAMAQSIEGLGDSTEEFSGESIDEPATDAPERVDGEAVDPFPESVNSYIAEPEEAPSAGDEVKPEDAAAASPEAEEQVSDARREDDPGLDDFDDSLLEEEDGDEFGLEDFDLSDIDDLPDLEADDEKRPDRPDDDGDKKA